MLPIIFAFVFSLLMSACIVDVGFDPRGDALSISSEWTVGGQGVSETSCETASISRVQLVFIDDDFEYLFEDFDFACTASPIDTRNEGNPGRLDRGNYTLFWQALDTEGNEVNRSSLSMVDLSADDLDHAALPNASF